MKRHRPISMISWHNFSTHISRGWSTVLCNTICRDENILNVTQKNQNFVSHTIINGGDQWQVPRGMRADGMPRRGQNKLGKYGEPLPFPTRIIHLQAYLWVHNYGHKIPLRPVIQAGIQNKYPNKNQVNPTIWP